MTIYELTPQTFGPTAVTQLPAIDFYAFALSQLPEVYATATNFLALVKVVSDQKQAIYDIIRSLVNVYNLNDTGNTTTPPGDSAVPTGVMINNSSWGPYIQMLASQFATPYSQGSSDPQIANAIKNNVNFVNSRGLPEDFFNYFKYNGFEAYFTNTNIQENGNATISFSMPINNTGPGFQAFQTSVLKLKGAGIKVVVHPLTVSLFQYGKLPSDSGPDVAPGNLGFGILQFNGDVINGGVFSSQIPPPV